MSVLSGIFPETVFSVFEEICSIPHGSRNTKQISDYCVRYAQKLGLKYVQDDHNNVIIFAPASVGYETAEPIILQGHLDMVCEKEADCPIDMDKEGLVLRTDGEWLWAEGTTLGGDDGIAVAYALAILSAADIPHPALEIVLTTDEEIGMFGAEALDASPLRGRMLMNIDSEEEGTLLVSCAGGVVSHCDLPVTREQQHGLRVQIAVSGLTGGHSGTEIHKGRGNANLLMGRLLYTLRKQIKFALCTLTGGKKDNAIPREATAELLISSVDLSVIQAFCAEQQQAYRMEYGSAEPLLSVSAYAKEEDTANVLTDSSTAAILRLLMLLPNGVQHSSADIPDLVQTSLNCGIVELTDAQFCITCGLRSSVLSEQQVLSEQICCLTELLGGAYRTEGEYPAWEYKPDSVLRERMTAVFSQQYGRKPVIQALHAGLECGILSAKLDGLDCVSFGPDIEEIHTTRERLSIPSVQRTWNYIIEVLRQSK